MDNNNTILDLATYLQVNLSINCTEDIQCIDPELETQVFTLNGFANTSEYRIISEGLYEIRAYGEDLNEDSIILEGVINEVFFSRLLVNDYNITAFQEFEIEVELYGADSELYDGVTRVTLIYPEGIIVKKATQVFKGTGTVTFTVYSIRSGEYEFQVDAFLGADDYFPGTLIVLVEPANIVIQAEPNVNSIQELEYLAPFAIEVYIVDNNWIVLENADYIQVNLSINCTQCILPDLESQLLTINGKVNSSYLYSIITEGYFEFSAAGEDLIPDSFIMHNGIYNVTNVEFILYGTNITIYEEFFIQVLVDDYFDQERFGNLMVSLVYPEEFVATESELAYEDKGVNIFSGYGTASGEYIFSAIVSVNGVKFTSGTLIVHIEPANIYIEAYPIVIFTQPNYIDSPFVIYTEILNNFGDVLEYADGLLVNLNINCTENTYCIDPLLEDFIITENGVSNTTEHKLKIWGTYEILATGDDLNSASMLIGEAGNTDINVSVIVYESYITIYQEFEIEVKLSTVYEETYSKSTFVNLINNEFVLERQYYLGKDSVIFKVYLTIPDVYEFGISLGRCQDFECILVFFTVEIGNANIILETNFYVILT